MTPLDALYVVVAVVVAIVGGALTLLVWQTVLVLSSLRSELLPKVEDLLSQSRKTMEQAGEIAIDVKEKLAKLEGTLDEAQVTVHSVVEAGNFVKDGIVKPTRVNLEALKAGSRAAWKRFNELRHDGRVARELPPAAPAAEVPLPQPEAERVP